MFLFKKYGIDGLDLDWEYPAIEGFPGHKYDAADKNNFTELIKALRKELGNDFLLTFAAGGFLKYLNESVDWDAVMPLVDFVNLMTPRPGGWLCNRNRPSYFATGLQARTGVCHQMC
ncbi:MAG: hypothetical protein IPO01_17705 [Chitinophagaceae bacterium]|nr:hypothetical protein [Chitinophagaceae bacterium]